MLRYWWIRYFGAPHFIVCDAGHENTGPEFRAACEFHNIHVHVIAGQAPWQNAVAERHGGTLKRMIYKCMQETTEPIKAIVVACTCAKNDAHQHFGHSPAVRSHSFTSRPFGRACESHLRPPTNPHIYAHPALIPAGRLSHNPLFEVF